MKITRSFWIAACSTFFFLSCTKEKDDVVDTSLNPPRLIYGAIQPTTVHLDTDRVNVVDQGNGRYQVTTSVMVQAIDLDGSQDINLLSFLVRSSMSSTPLGSGTVPSSSLSGDTAQYAGTISFSMNKSDAGINAIEFQANDNSNLLSNALSISLTVNRNNSRPQVFNLSAPDTVVRPSSGSQPVFFAISASDSDGLADIASVFLKSPNSSNPDQEFPLYDDGNLPASGDTIAGDGRYSTIIYLFPSFPLGTREFRFWARDNTGALSDSLPHFITVIP